MSLNYPDRDKWLAIRKTSTKARLGKLIFTATDYRLLQIQPGMPVQFVRVAKGKSYRRAESV